MTTPTRETLVILGSGPAAWTAAIYAARANLNPLVFEGEPMGIMLPGGQLMVTTEIENFPGFPHGITGPELMDHMRAQALRFGARVVSEMVREVDLSRRPFTLTPNYSAPVEALSVIVATGANAKWLGVPNEERLAQSGAASPPARSATARFRSTATRCLASSAAGTPRWRRVSTSPSSRARW
jgi:thioredoxin reductase (NADPH)